MKPQVVKKVNGKKVSKEKVIKKGQKKPVRIGTKKPEVNKYGRNVKKTGLTRGAPKKIVRPPISGGKAPTKGIVKPINSELKSKLPKRQPI